MGFQIALLVIIPVAKNERGDRNSAHGASFLLSRLPLRSVSYIRGNVDDIRLVLFPWARVRGHMCIIGGGGLFLWMLLWVY